MLLVLYGGGWQIAAILNVDTDAPDLQMILSLAMHLFDTNQKLKEKCNEAFHDTDGIPIYIFVTHIFENKRRTDSYHITLLDIII